MRLEQWYIGNNEASPYTPPEQVSKRAYGYVYGHPKFADGTWIHTSRIVGVEGKAVLTNSGNLYELGEVSSDYVKYCKDNGLHVPTPEEPVKA